MYAVVRGPDRFVVMGSYRCIHILDDGTTNIYTTAYQYPFSIYYDGTYYWVAANHGTQILRSPDAVTWTLITLPGASATVISVGGEGSKILVGRNIGYYTFSSDGGASWATYRLGFDAHWVSDVNLNKYILANFDEVFTSPTAGVSDWTIATNSDFAVSAVSGAKFGKNGNVIVHSEGGLPNTNVYKLSADNGATFGLATTTAFPCTINRDCIFDGTRFLLTGSNGDIVYLGPDGLGGAVLTNVGVGIQSIAFGNISIKGIYPKKDGIWRRAREVYIAQSNTGILGTIYQTVIMPDGKEWMAESLRYAPLGRYFYDDPLYFTAYGKYYSFAERDAIKAILPDGWRIPTEEEWLDMIAIPGVSGNSLSFPGDYYWRVDNGTNETGFSALAGGLYQFGSWQNWAGHPSQPSEFIAWCDGMWSVDPTKYVCAVIAEGNAFPYARNPGINSYNTGGGKIFNIRLVRDPGPSSGRVWRKANRVFIADAGAWREVL